MSKKQYKDSKKSPTSQVKTASSLRVFDIHLEKKFGMKASAFICQVHYWLKKSENIFDGVPWTYHNYGEWQAEFPNWSLSTLKSIVRKLRHEKILLVDCRKSRDKNDWTNWYTLNYSHQDLAFFQVSKTDTTGVKNRQHRCQKLTPQVSKTDPSYTKTTAETSAKSTTDTRGARQRSETSVWFNQQEDWFKKEIEKYVVRVIERKVGIGNPAAYRWGIIREIHAGGAPDFDPMTPEEREEEAARMGI